MKALRLAHYIINKCVVLGKPINNLRLNLMLYLMHKDCLQKYIEPLFEDEVIVGKGFPKIQEVYWEYCCYGALRIYSAKVDLLHPIRRIDFVKNRIEFYNELTTKELCALATKDDGAWDLCNRYKIDEKDVIPNELILTRG